MMVPVRPTPAEQCIIIGALRTVMPCETLTNVLIITGNTSVVFDKAEYIFSPMWNSIIRPGGHLQIDLEFKKLAIFTWKCVIFL